MRCPPRGCCFPWGGPAENWLPGAPLRVLSLIFLPQENARLCLLAAATLRDDARLMMTAPDLKRALGSQGSRQLMAALLVLLALLAAAYWLRANLRQAQPLAPLAAAPATPLPSLVSASQLGRLLGASGSAATVAPGPLQRFMVVGVIAGASGRGVALISVDGQAPQPFAVGAELAPGFVVKSLGMRQVMLATSLQDPVSVTLPMPALEALPLRSSEPASLGARSPGQAPEAPLQTPAPGEPTPAARPAAASGAPSAPS